TCTITDANSCYITKTVTIGEPALFTATISSANVSCNGGANGTATVIPDGGTAPYSYSWTSSGGATATATGLSAGVYTCTITDANGCTTVRTTTISQPPAIAVTTSQVNASAVGFNDGSATVSVSGGTPAYSYSWSPLGGTAATATGLAAGVYTCTITDANACTFTQTFTILEPSSLSAFSFADKKYGDAPFSITAPESNSNATFSYVSSNTEVATINGNTITIIQPGTSVITANQAANAGHTGNTITATITVLPKDLTVSINADEKTNKVYDGNTSALVTSLNYQLHGVVGSDEVGVTGTAVYDSKDAGLNKTITAGSFVLTGAQKDYYVIATNSANVSGSITKKIIIPTEAPITKVYDGTNVATVTFNSFATEDGLVENDDLKLQYIAASYNSKDVGAGKPISFTGLALSGADKDNYQFDELALKGDITAKGVTVTTTEGQSKIYGTSDPSLTYEITSGGSLAEGDAFTGILQRASGENAGAYAIEQGTLSAGSNYSLTFVGSDFTITPKAITITANNDQSKEYGTTDPSLTYIISEGSLEEADEITGTLDRVEGENAGDYAIGQGTLTAGSNYSLSFVGANFTITPKPITITAVGQTKVYGEADPAFAYSFEPALISGDHFTGSLNRQAGKNVGEYGINIGSLSAGANYTVTTYTPAVFTITPAPLVISAENKTKTQGTANPAFTFNYQGLKEGDTPSDLTSLPQANTTAVNASPIGYYDITLGGATSSNYTISYLPGILSVLPSGNNHLKAWTSSLSVLEIRVYSEGPQKSAITLYTNTGQPVATIQKQLQAGVNSFTMNVANLASGVYILSAVSDNFKEAQKIKIK
ncbi:MAG: MBG domain-containing protein, partial [Ginsengibacter sp.]